jgi:hypothetical protein
MAGRCEKPGHIRQTWGGMAWSPCLACKREECFEEAGYARGLQHGMVAGSEDTFREGMAVGAALIAWAEAIRETYDTCDACEGHGAHFEPVHCYYCRGTGRR